MKPLEQMMEELLRLYPNHHWELSMRMERDGGHGDLVSCIFAGFGYTNEDRDFMSAYINESGDVCEQDDPGAFELADWSLEWTYYALVKGIYDEVMKRRSK